MTAKGMEPVAVVFSEPYVAREPAGLSRRKTRDTLDLFAAAQR